MQKVWSFVAINLPSQVLLSAYMFTEKVPEVSPSSASQADFQVPVSWLPSIVPERSAMHTGFVEKLTVPVTSLHFWVNFTSEASGALIPVHESGSPSFQLRRSRTSWLLAYPTSRESHVYPHTPFSFASGHAVVAGAIDADAAGVVSAGVPVETVTDLLAVHPAMRITRIARATRRNVARSGFIQALTRCTAKNVSI